MHTVYKLQLSGGSPGGFCCGKWSRETRAEAAPGSWLQCGVGAGRASAAGLSPQILTCLLTEQRLVFFSASWALLTLVAECFLVYLHPLRWQHTLVPILSGQMLDFLMAPTAFLMGCHLSHFEEVSKVRYRPGPALTLCERAQRGAGRCPADSGAFRAVDAASGVLLCVWSQIRLHWEAGYIF